MSEPTKWGAPWTEEEIETLKEFAEKGLSDEEIAKRLGRTYWAVKNKRLKELGIKYRGRKVDLEELRRLSEMGFGSKRLAKHLGVSPSTIKYYKRRYGIKRAGLAPQRMTVEKLELLKKLYETDMTLKEIARRLDVSLKTLLRWCRRLGLPHRPRGGRGPRPKPSLITKAKALEIVRRLGIATVADVANALGLSETTTLHYLRLLCDEGAIRMFRVRGAISGHLRISKFFRLPPSALVFYTDEETLVRWLCERVEIHSKGEWRALRAMLKNNKVSREGVKCFIKLYEEMRGVKLP
jgi:DNA-binding CsgD family transcriptional regulator